MSDLAPQKDVVEVRELPGPRGGVTMVMRLECGHMVWRRMKRPPQTMRCVMCWWDAGTPA